MHEPNSVIDLLTYRLLRLSNSFGLYAGRRYRDEFAVSMPEWRVMSIIAMRGTTSAREISRILATDKAWVGLTVEALRKRGYVTAMADIRDKRRTLVALSPEGRAVHDAILAIARQRQRRLLAALPPGAAETLIDCLDRLQVEADRMLEELDAAEDVPVE